MFMSELRDFLVIEPDGLSKTYKFPKKGLYWDYCPIVGHIWNAGIYLSDRGGWGDLFQGWKPFTATLPFGIERSDTMREVAKRLSTSPADHEARHSPKRLPDDLLPENFTERDLRRLFLQLEKAPYVADDYTFKVPPFDVTCTFLRADGRLTQIRIYKQLWAIHGFDSIPGGTELAKLSVIQQAECQAKGLHYNWVGTEMLLLGILGDQNSDACRILRRQRVSVSAVRREIKRLNAQAIGELDERLPFTPRAKQVLKRLWKRRKQLQQYAAADLLLLELLNEGDGLLKLILDALSVDVSFLKQQLEMAMNESVATAQ
jgi:hypothetical protein